MGLSGLGRLEQFQVDFADGEEGGAHFLRGDFLAVLAFEAERLFVIWHGFVQRLDGDSEMVNFFNHNCVVSADRARRGLPASRGGWTAVISPSQHGLRAMRAGAAMHARVAGKNRRCSSSRIKSRQPIERLLLAALGDDALRFQFAGKIARCAPRPRTRPRRSGRAQGRLRSSSREWPAQVMQDALPVRRGPASARRRFSPSALLIRMASAISMMPFLDALQFVAGARQQQQQEKIDHRAQRDFALARRRRSRRGSHRSPPPRRAASFRGVRRATPPRVPPAGEGRMKACGSRLRAFPCGSCRPGCCRRRVCWWDRWPGRRACALSDQSIQPSASMNVLLPTPGTPVMPTRLDLPVCGSNSSQDLLRLRCVPRGHWLSMSVIARGQASRGSPASTRRHNPRRAVRVDETA